MFFGRTGPNSASAVISKVLPCHRVDLVGWLFVFAIHAVVVVASAANHTLIPDENAYINLAENLVQHGSYHLDFGSFWHVSDQPYTYFAPGWPFLLSMGYAVAGLTGCWVIMWLVWCLNSVLADRLASTLGFTRQWRWAFVGWVTFNPLFLFYHGHMMTESAVIGLNLALTAIGIRLIESPTTWGVISFAAVAAAAHMTRSQTMLTVIAVWLVAGVTIQWRRMIPLFLLFAVVHVGLLFPWLWRMNHVGGSPFSTELKLGINLYQYSGTPVADPYAPDARSTLPAGVEMMTPRERNRVLTQEALKQIVREPDKYFKKCLSRSFYLFSPVPSFYQVGRLQYMAFLGSSLAFYHTLFIVAAVGLIRRGPFRADVWLMVVALGFWYAFHIMVNASIRQRLPSDIWIAALAIATWTRPAALWNHCVATANHPPRSSRRLQQSDLVPPPQNREAVSGATAACNPDRLP